MTLTKQAEGLINENIILTSQEIISYFYEISDKISSSMKENNEATEENKKDIFQQDEVIALSKEIGEYISRKIDVLKKNKKYYGTDILKLLHYALVSLIDEMLITKNWSGRIFWRSETLENRIFSSRSSGDLFFENCNRILLDKDYKYRELAMCYYLCLCSGFRGKFHSQDNQAKVEQIKTELYQFHHETNFEPVLGVTGILPNISYISSNNDFETNHKKITYSLLFSNLFLFTFFLAASIYIWLVNSNILSKGIM
jgi:type IV/VI secretion system ImpK/VasF family protein